MVRQPHRVPDFVATFAWIVLGSLLATASDAQFPTIRIIPDSPLASHRVYLEVGVTPCTIFTTDVISHGPDIRVVELVTVPCQDTLPKVGKLVVPLGPFPEGGSRVGVSVDGVHRTLTFEVAPPQQDPAFVDDGAAIVGDDRRADHSLEMPSECLYDLVTDANDGRTEIVVNRIAQPARLCPVVAPPLPPTRIGFPRPGQHLVILKYAGVVARTQLITVTQGFEKLDYSDLWWVEGESGWGLTIQQHGKDRLFAVLYGYRGDGKPLWLSMSGGDWDSGTSVTGSFNVSRGNSQSGPYDPAKGSQTPVALGTLEFLSADTATLTLKRSTFDFPGLEIPMFRSWILKRQPF